MSFYLFIRWSVMITVNLPTADINGDYLSKMKEDYWFGLHVFPFMFMCANTELISGTVITSLVMQTTQLFKINFH